MGRKPTIPTPPGELLRELLDYNPETGSLQWRRRSIRYFESLRACESWNGHYAGQQAGWINANGYLATRLGRPSYLTQRLIWKLMTNEEPPEQIDHVDGNRTNNRWNNLRAADHKINILNRGKNKNNTSGFRGVRKHGNKWAAFLRNKYLGAFKTPEEASVVYESAAKSLRGEFYRKS